MSTSPSWFDQEKFSRLVRKVGPKGPVGPSGPAIVTKTGAMTKPPEKETRRLQRSMEGSPRGITPPAKASQSLPRPRPSDTAIRATPAAPDTESSGFPQALPVPEPRSVSPLARRTTSLPNLKPIFEYDRPALSKSQPLRPPTLPPQVPDVAAEPETEEGGDQPETSASEFSTFNPAEPATAWPSFGGEPSGETEETQPAGESSEDLGQVLKERDELRARVEELSRTAQERDDARNEIGLLRAQLLQADEIIQATAIPGSNQEDLSRVIDERDHARRDYANLREQFENLKREPSRAESSSEPSAAVHNMIEKLREELNAVQAQLNQSRDEASMAQRGLALSQKALQETREALREASEGSSTSRANLESLKHESATLSQQNLQLQSKVEQLERDLDALKGKSGEQY